MKNLKLLLCLVASTSALAADPDDVTTTVPQTQRTDPVTQVELRLTYLRDNKDSPWRLVKVDAQKTRTIRVLTQSGAEAGRKITASGFYDITDLVITNGAPSYPAEPFNGFVNTATGNQLRLQPVVPVGALAALKVRLGE